MQNVPDHFTILVVEDNPADVFILEQMLQASRLHIETVLTVSRLEEACCFIKHKAIHLILLDLSLPDSFGISTLKEIRYLTQGIPVIVLTGLSDTESAIEALNQQAQDYLVKGEFNANLLRKAIEYSIERKKIEDSIRASEDKYRQMFYRNPFPMWINDAGTLQILEVNDAAIQKYGYSRSEFVQLTLHDIQASATKQAKADKHLRHRKKNGDIMIVEFTYYPIAYFGRTAMQAQVNDITENIRLTHELELKKQQLVEAVLHAQEAERKIIGEELHDNVNQILTAVKLNLCTALEQKDLREPLLERCIKNMATAIDEIRKISKELILPGNLKELGLVHAVEDLLVSMFQLTPTKCTFTSNGTDNTLSQDQKLAAYRIVQEQLNNIVKYAKASAVAVELNMNGSQVNLAITDNGIGFDTAKRRDGIGIHNMISRAELFNGEVNVQSSPGSGCRLHVVLNAKKNLAPPAARLHSAAAN
jgi:two-component system sensor histidine kinase UhpB